MHTQTYEKSPGGPSARAGHPGGGTTPPRAAAPPKPLAPRHRLKFVPKNERLKRRVVGVLAAPVALFFLACALAAWSKQRPVVPVPFGSGLMVELGIAAFPGLWWLSVLHNLLLAAVALGFLFGVSSAHVEIPDDPRNADVVVWRRQAVFPYPTLLGSALLFGLGAAVRQAGHPVVAALLESPGCGLAIAALAHMLVPIARQFVTLVIDVEREGLGSHLTLGGGGRPTLVIFPEQLISIERRTSPLEWCLGLASLRFEWWVEPGVTATRNIRAFASAQATEAMVKYVLSRLPVSRRHKGLDYPAGFPLRPPAPPTRAH